MYTYHAPRWKNPAYAIDKIFLILLINEKYMFLKNYTY